MHARDHARELGAVRTGLFLASVLCLTEAVGGYLTNSLALVSDAAHVMGDVGALGLTLFALWVGTRPASESKTFGYHRAEILAALVNGVILWVVGILIVGLIVFGSGALVREAVDVLMEAVPAHIDVETLRLALERVPGTDEVHDLHVWSLTTGRYALSAHAVVNGAAGDDAILAAMADLCAREFQIEHVTIQIEHESRRAAEPAH